MSSDSLGMNAPPLTISERSRMNPTCGPLPCVTTTRQPASTRAPTCCATAAALANCSAMVPDCPSAISALPPIAISAR
jgi:hypothetical protein